jgi:putative ABC transport system permease protein
MIRNYIVIALRLLRKNKMFSFINIIGLAVGIACCILITLHIEDEFNYEKGFSDYEKIFRINTTFIQDGNAEVSPYTSPPIAMELAHTLPEVQTATRVVRALGVDQHIVRYGDKSFFEQKAFLVDSTFLDVFPYKLVEGNAATALDAPSTVLLSEQLAKKIFGSQSAVDELIMISSGTSADTFRVTGVVAKPPLPSQIDANIYMSLNSSGLGQWILSQRTWANNNIVVGYVKLHDPEAHKAIEPKIAHLLETHAGAELRASGRKKIMRLQELADTRLYSGLGKASADTENGSSITYIYIIATMAIFILLLACINFMNLTTAKSAQRAGEVGIRKSMGATRTNLIPQFLGESMVIVVFAMFVSFVIVILLLPLFNDLMQKQLTLNANNLPFIAGATAVICVLTALVAGSYPAFFLSSLKATQVLKGKSWSAGGSQWLRKGLVVLQFVITITLISSIVIVQQQLKFIQSKSLGFDTDHVIMIPLRTQQALQQYQGLRESFKQVPGVNMVSATTGIPSTPLFSDWRLYKEGATNDQSVTHDLVFVDRDYFNVLDIRLIAGRDFIAEQDNLPGDTINPVSIIVNEASLKAFGIPLEKAVGSTVYFEPGDERYKYSIIGVVKDFHQFSLHREIRPMSFVLPWDRNGFRYMAASIRMESHQEITDEMKKLWDERINDAPFERIFLDENLETLYAAEARTSTVLTISTTIALLISCIGLYGLSLYVAERKTKEIGIRKVVGASVGSIVGMLSKEYIMLVGISFAISVPLGYYFMNKWLEGFAYKISPGMGVFIIAGLVSFLIAWFTISFESFRAASKNPVDSIRVN